MSAVTTHVLDTVHGRPAVGVRVRLGGRGATAGRVGREREGATADGATADGATADGWNLVAEASTDDDGRVRDLGPDRLEPGTYRLRFDTGAWFSARGVPAYYPEVTVAFAVTDAGHHHVPLLLAPFTYSPYRGS